MAPASYGHRCRLGHLVLLQNSIRAKGAHKASRALLIVPGPSKEENSSSSCLPPCVQNLHQVPFRACTCTLIPQPDRSSVLAQASSQPRSSPTLCSRPLQCLYGCRLASLLGLLRSPSHARLAWPLQPDMLELALVLQQQVSHGGLMSPGCLTSWEDTHAMWYLRGPTYTTPNPQP